MESGNDNDNAYSIFNFQSATLLIQCYRRQAFLGIRFDSFIWFSIEENQRKQDRIYQKEWSFNQSSDWIQLDMNSNWRGRSARLHSIESYYSLEKTSLDSMLFVTSNPLRNSKLWFFIIILSQYLQPYCCCLVEGVKRIEVVNSLIWFTRVFVYNEPISRWVSALCRSVSFVLLVRRFFSFLEGRRTKEEQDRWFRRKRGKIK